MFWHQNNMAASNTGHMVDDFENSFQACLASLTNQDHFNVHDSEEVRSESQWTMVRSWEAFASPLQRYSTKRDALLRNHDFVQGAEQTLQRFLDMAKHMECFFLQKRLLLSAQKPEQILREDINELKLELARKDLLIQKHYEKIQHWQTLLSDLQGPGRPPQPPPPMAPITVSQQQPSPVMVPATSIPTPMQPPPPQMYGPPSGQPHMSPVSHPGPQSSPGAGMMSGLQGPLAYLEKTTSNIGMAELRRQ